jgi:hypothetical protein
MTFKAAIAALAAIAFCLGLAAQEEPRLDARTETRSESLAYGSKLWVKNRNGAISVNGWDKEEVSLTAEIRDSDQRRIELAVQRVGPDMAIEARFVQPRLSLGLSPAPTPWCRMTLNVPDKLLGHFRALNGPISVGRVIGFVHCETVNGDISLSSLAGEVQVETVNGNIDARELHARIKGGTANGGIMLENVDGQVRMETTNGFITARNLDGWGEGISLSSTNGAIELELGRAAGDLVAENAHGDIRVRVGGAQVLELGKHRVHVRIPGSSQKILLGTTNGSIEVH